MRYHPYGMGKPRGLMPPSSPSDDGDKGTEDHQDKGKAPSTIFFHNRFDEEHDYVPPARSPSTPNNDQLDYLLYGDTDWWRKEAKARGEVVYDADRVESVKFIATSGEAPKRKRSPLNANTMAGTYEETTSSTKRITFKARMSVKPQEEWVNPIHIEEVEPSSEEDETSLEDRVTALEVNEQSAINCYYALIDRVDSLERREYSHHTFEIAMKTMEKLEKDLKECKRRIAALEATNSHLRQALNRNTLNERNRGTE